MRGGCGGIVPSGNGNPLDWRDNDYVIDAMREAIDEWEKHTVDSFDGAYA